jgi:hypothetical protein
MPSSIVLKDGDVFLTEFAVSNHFEGAYSVLPMGGPGHILSQAWTGLS